MDVLADNGSKEEWSSLLIIIFKYFNKKIYLLSAKKHDEVKEWVLAISMDQKVEQQLPLDSR
jgi:hypothetical protein